MARAIDKQTMLDLIVEAKRTDPETGGFAEWLAEYLAEHLPTLTPPNEPLTLDELRKMKDEPTYLKVFDPLLKSGWHIVKAVTEDKIIFRDWQTVYVPIDGMGVDYNLYRRPPEGKEDIK
ncbi:MAG TPA: hypothetical protein H9739_01525 [Candidatus Agathobaculum pullistercoris]|nr:hypothetical protein [uncultured Agathobaculum sp.]HIX10247.1 hypothetical protein [Candidatus Agathobaculum pullistercoris]